MMNLLEIVTLEFSQIVSAQPYAPTTQKFPGRFQVKEKTIIYRSQVYSRFT